MIDPEFLAKVSNTYAKHPLTAATILERVRRQKGTLLGITELDLATDVNCGLTDQNHAGGADAVREIARLVNLQSNWSVLDVGTGLGGAARVLASEFGCRCHGVELTETRYRDALDLTDRVGLCSKVSFTHGDFMSVEVPDATFDLVLGQAAFMHFPDLKQLLTRCHSVLRPGRWLVIEDGFLKRAPKDSESSDLDQLCNKWNGQMFRLDEWEAWLGETGYSVPHVMDLSAGSASDLRDYMRKADAGQMGFVPAGEYQGWQLAVRLSDAGVLGSMRLLTRSL